VGGIINDDWTKPAFNEFVVHHEGDVDTNEFIEISGYPSTNYSDYSILVIENDGDENPGVIDREYTLGTTDTQGIWRTPFLNNELEDGRCILILIEGFTGQSGRTWMSIMISGLKYIPGIPISPRMG
jgi:hypothetical protein